MYLCNSRILGWWNHLKSSWKRSRNSRKMEGRKADWTALHWCSNYGYWWHILRSWPPWSYMSPYPWTSACLRTCSVFGRGFWHNMWWHPCSNHWGTKTTVWTFLSGISMNSNSIPNSVLVGSEPTLCRFSLWFRSKYDLGVSRVELEHLKNQDDHSFILDCSNLIIEIDPLLRRCFGHLLIFQQPGLIISIRYRKRFKAAFRCIWGTRLLRLGLILILRDKRRSLARWFYRKSQQILSTVNRSKSRWGLGQMLNHHQH
jgi:hypothetical protein